MLCHLFSNKEVSFCEYIGSQNQNVEILISLLIHFVHLNGHKTDNYAPVNVYPQVGDRGQTRGFLTLKIFVVRIPCMSKGCTVRKSLYLSIYSIHFVRKPHPGEQGLCQTSLYGSKVVVRIPLYACGPPLGIHIDWCIRVLNLLPNF